MSITIISGPKKGGKSLWAEKLLQKQTDVIYIATGMISDEDENWNERIKLHRERRNKEWKTIESNENLALTIDKIDSGKTLLIDSLGGFVSSLIDHSDEVWLNIRNQFINSLNNYNGDVIIVSEEVGWGLMSEYVIGNTFVDRLGLITRDIEYLAKESWLVLHGKAVNLTKIGIEIGYE